MLKLINYHFSMQCFNNSMFYLLVFSLISTCMGFTKAQMDSISTENKVNKIIAQLRQGEIPGELSLDDIKRFANRIRPVASDEFCKTASFIQSLATHEITGLNKEYEYVKNFISQVNSCFFDTCAIKLLIKIHQLNLVRKEYTDSDYKQKWYDDAFGVLLDIDNPIAVNYCLPIISKKPFRDQFDFLHSTHFENGNIAYFKYYTGLFDSLIHSQPCGEQLYFCLKDYLHFFDNNRYKIEFTEHLKKLFTYLSEKDFNENKNCIEAIASPLCKDTSENTLLFFEKYASNMNLKGHDYFRQYYSSSMFEQPRKKRTSYLWMKTKAAKTKDEKEFYFGLFIELADIESGTEGLNNKLADQYRMKAFTFISNQTDSLTDDKLAANAINFIGSAIWPKFNKYTVQIKSEFENFLSKQFSKYKDNERLSSYIRQLMEYVEKENPSK